MARLSDSLSVHACGRASLRVHVSCGWPAQHFGGCPIPTPFTTTLVRLLLFPWQLHEAQNMEQYMPWNRQQSQAKRRNNPLSGCDHNMADWIWKQMPAADIVWVTEKTWPPPHPQKGQKKTRPSSWTKGGGKERWNQWINQDRKDWGIKGNAKENFYEAKEGRPACNGSTSPAWGTFSQTITS